MKLSKFQPPYKESKPGKRPGVSSHIRAVQGKAGVYIIQKKGGRKPLYIGHSTTNLYVTILRHFQSWDDKRQVRVTYPKQGYNVRVIVTTPKRAIALERALIIKHRPKDNPNKLSLFEVDDLSRYEVESLNGYQEGEVIPF